MHLPYRCFIDDEGQLPATSGPADVVHRSMEDRGRLFSLNF